MARDDYYKPPRYDWGKGPVRGLLWGIVALALFLGAFAAIVYAIVEALT